VKTGRGPEQLERLQRLCQNDFHIAANLTDAAYWVCDQIACEQLERTLLQAVPEFAIEMT
jgi:hypothetical protein